MSPTLEAVTRKRIVNSGIPCDVVCLGTPPMHVVPLFEIKGKDLNELSKGQNVDVLEEKVYFETPGWLTLHYYTNAKRAHKLLTVNGKTPLGHCAGLLQRLGTSELKLAQPPQPIRPPAQRQSPHYTTSRADYSGAYFESHDQAVFERDDVSPPSGIFCLQQVHVRCWSCMRFRGWFVRMFCILLSPRARSGVSGLA